MTIHETKEEIRRVEDEIREKLNYLASLGVRVRRIDIRYLNVSTPAERFRHPVVADVSIEAEI